MRARRGYRRRFARIGSGAGTAQVRSRGPRRPHLGPNLMSAQLDAQAAGAAENADRADGHSRIHLSKSTTAIMGDDRVTGLTFADGTSLYLRYGCDLRRHPPQRRDCKRHAILPSNAPLSWTIRCARCRIRISMWSANAPSTGASPTVSSRRSGSRDRCSPIISPAVKPNAAYKGSKLVTKLKVMGIHLVSMGVTQAGARHG